MDWVDLGETLLRTSLAVIFAAALACFSYGIARTLWRGDAVGRFSGAVVLALTFLTIAFHALMALGCFRLTWALAVVLLAATACLARGLSWRDSYTQLFDDIRTLSPSVSMRIGSWQEFVGAAALLGFFLTTVRTMLLPPLGWDSMTYHAVKAAFWVQTGGFEYLDAPGGWSFYRHYLGGGEVLTAWAMLLFHADTLASLVDAVVWVIHAILLFGIASELGLSSRAARAVALYVSFLPALLLSVGSGYVEPTFNLCVAAAIFHALRTARHGSACDFLASMAALALAANVKINGMPLLFLLGAFLLYQQLRRQRPLSTRLGVIAIAVGTTLSILSPWLVLNLVRTGYPFAHTPLSVLGVPLGVANDALLWFLDHPEIEPYLWETEYPAFIAMFLSPWSPGPHLSALSVPLLFLGLVGVVRSGNRRWREVAILGAVVVATLAVHFHPGFSVIRILYYTNGRFLVPLVASCLLLGLLGSSERFRWLVVLYLEAGTLLHMASHLLAGWSLVDLLGVGLLACLILAGGSAVRMMATHGAFRAQCTAGAVLLVFVVLLSAMRGQTRYRFVRQSVVLHSTRVYWANSAEQLDSWPAQHRIAITAGPARESDNWFAYYFLGSRLQNQLLYIPLGKDGRPLEMRGDQARNYERMVSREEWLRRLHAAGATHVVSLRPSTRELAWMESDPRTFEHLNGDRRSWGSYRIIR